MVTSRSARTFVSVLSLVVVTSGWWGAATADAAKRVPVLRVAPATGLTNGRSVVVSGKGFKAHDQVYIVECLATAKGGGQCNIAGVVPVTITAKGILPPTPFKVIAGSIANGRCGTTKANVRGCELSAGNATGGDSASVVITFKAPKK